MDPWPIGIFTSVGAGLGLPLPVAVELGISTIHLYAPAKEQRNLETANALRAQLRDANIAVTCLFMGFQGESYADIPTVQRTVGLVNPETQTIRVAELKQISDFGELMQVPAIGLHLGYIPNDPESSSYANLVKVLRNIADHLAKRGQALHLETGQESATALINFLAAVNKNNLFVNFDPANMILYGVAQPLLALKQLGPRVRSVHCKDATWSEQPGVTWGKEVPLGQGQVNIPEFLRVLQEIGYKGPLTIEREIPQEPERQRSEIGSAVTLLNSIKQDLLALEI